MKKLFLMCLLASGCAIAQSPIPPDCGPTRFNLTGAGQNSATFTNFTATSGQACVVWELRYGVAGGTASAVSIVVQAAPAGSSPTSPGSFTTYPGTAVNGSITSTNTSGASALLSDGATYVPFIRVHLTTFTGSTGSPIIYGVLQGWNAGNAAAIIAGGGSGGTGCPNPCPVIQSTAANLNAQVQGPDAANASTTGNPNLGGWADGAGHTVLAFMCPNQSPFNISAGTDAVIVAGTMGKKTYLCHVDFASDTVVDFTIRQGTGSTCSMSTGNLTGTYKNISVFAMDYQPTAPLHTTTAADDMCVHASATANVGGTAYYYQN